MSDAADFRAIPLDSIRVGPRLRVVSAAHVDHIAASLTEYGRVAPIIVRPDPERDGGYLLVAGAHRLAAARKAGRTAIDAEVRSLGDEQAQAVEIAENLFRYELTALDRANALAALDTIVTPNRTRGRGGARPGAGRKSGSKSTAHNAVDLFADLEAEVRKRLKLAERTIYQDMAIARSLDPEAARLVALTPVAGNLAQLKLLARLDPEKQRAVASGVADGLRFAKALEAAGAARPQISADNAAFNKLVALWEGANTKVKRRFLAHIEGKRPAPLKLVPKNKG